MKHLVICFFLLITSSFLCAQTYTPTDKDSKVHFVIRNFGIRSGGDFSGLKGNIVFNPEALNTCRFDVTVDAGTVDTDNKTRDNHLRSADYFDTGKYPLIGFKSSRVTASTVPGQYDVTGMLTIKGISRELQFGFSATPVNKDYLFTGTFEINRLDFGVGGNSLVLSEEVLITLTVIARK